MLLLVHGTFLGCSMAYLLVRGARWQADLCLRLAASEGHIRGRPALQARQATLTPPAERPAAQNRSLRVTRSSCRRLIT